MWSTLHAVVKLSQLARLKSIGLKKSLMRSVKRNVKMSFYKGLKKAKIKQKNGDFTIYFWTQAKTISLFLVVKRVMEL